MGQPRTLVREYPGKPGGKRVSVLCVDSESEAGLLWRVRVPQGPFNTPRNIRIGFVRGAGEIDDQQASGRVLELEQDLY